MADDLSSSSSSCNLKTNPNFQLISSIILHDISLLCSFIISYPLYFSYFIFFYPYIITLISFISPLFLVTVFLSLLLTSTTAFCPKLPQLELVILQSVIQELKSNLHDVNGDEDSRNFEDFEIYKIVFDCTLPIAICSEGDEIVSPTNQIIENLVPDGRKNDVTTTDSGMNTLLFDGVSCTSNDSVTVTNSDSVTEKLAMEKNLEHSAHGGRRNDVKVTDSVTENLSVEKLPQYRSGTDTLHFDGIGSNFVTVTDSVTEKLGVEKILTNSVHGGRRNEVTATDSVTSNLGAEKILEHSVHGGRRNDVTVTDSVTEKLGVEKILEGSFHGGRRSDVTSSDSDADDESVRFEDFTTATETDTDSDKVTGVLQKAEAGAARKLDSGSEAINSGDDDKLSQNSVRSSNLTSYGSMREEKEWRRTLACKLFEERHNSRGEEGMDSLWEVYENDNKSRLMMMKNSYNNRSFNDDDVEEDEDEMEMSNGHLCCLQALRLSTGKMNLGMGKISKALKGFGWLHHAKKNKHGKKR